VGCCYAAGAFSVGSVLGATTSSIYDCCYVAGAFSLGSVLGSLLGNDIYIKSSLFFATEQRERNRTRTAEYRATVWDTPSLLSSEYRGPFLRDETVGA
jgi:hypothetical protein